MERRRHLSSASSRDSLGKAFAGSLLDAWRLIALLVTSGIWKLTHSNFGYPARQQRLGRREYGQDHSDSAPRRPGESSGQRHEIAWFRRRRSR